MKSVFHDMAKMHSVLGSMAPFQPVLNSSSHNILHLYFMRMVDPNVNYSSPGFAEKLVQSETTDTNSVRFLLLATRNPYLHLTPPLSLDSLVHSEYIPSNLQWDTNETTTVRIHFSKLGSVLIEQMDQLKILELLHHWLFLRDDQSKLWLPYQESKANSWTSLFYLLPVFDYSSSIHILDFVQSQYSQDKLIPFPLLLRLLHPPMNMEKLIVDSNFREVQAIEVDNLISYTNGLELLERECRKAHINVRAFSKEIAEIHFSIDMVSLLDQCPQYAVLLESLESVSKIVSGNIVLFNSQVYMIVDVDFASPEVKYVCVELDSSTLTHRASIFEKRKDFDFSYTRSRCKQLLSNLPSLHQLTDRDYLARPNLPPRGNEYEYIGPSDCCVTRLKYEPAALMNMMNYTSMFLSEVHDKQLGLTDLQNGLKINFTDHELLQKCFMHKTFTQDFYGSEHDSNELLEFLGDGLIELLAGHMYFEAMKDADGSSLRLSCSLLVENDSLDDLSQTLDLRSILLKTRQLHPAQRERKVGADTVEALIAAIYLDQDIEGSLKFWMRYMPPWGPDEAKHSFEIESHLPLTQSLSGKEIMRLRQTEQMLGVRFNNPRVLIEALQTISSTNNGKKTIKRLEQLGSCVLKFVVCNNIYHEYQASYEKQVSDIFMEYTTVAQLAKAAREMELHTLCDMEVSDRNLAKMFRAIIGAIYVDQGGLCNTTHDRSYDVKNSIIHVFLLEAKTFTVRGKNELDDVLMRLLRCSACIVSTANRHSQRLYACNVSTDSTVIATGYGRTKKEAYFDAIDRAWHVSQHVLNLRKEKEQQQQLFGDFIDLQMQQQSLFEGAPMTNQNVHNLKADLEDLDVLIPQLQKYRLHNTTL